VNATATGDLTKLPMLVDPRGWSRSAFWLASDRAQLVNGRFEPVPNDTSLGTPWQGYLYEYFVVPDSGCLESAFQVYLNIDFSVPMGTGPDPTLAIDLEYSLFTATGNLQLMRVAAGGVQIDSGAAKVYIQSQNGADTTVEYKVSKRVRYSDVLSRSTPGQGAAGAGNILNLNAPAVLSTWMKDLVLGTLEEWEAIS
jgi:hypothetical protein